MKTLYIILLLAIPALSQNPLASNGSGCVANGTPSYCSAASPVITTNVANTGAITIVTDPLPASTNISNVLTLLYAGANPKVVFHFQDWWGCSGHMNIGQAGNNPSLIAAQASTMVSYNGYGLVIDWAGNRDSGKACRLAVTNAWATYLTGHFPGVPLRMGIMVDGGGLTAACPTGATPSETCLTTELNAELDYVNTNYIPQSWYLMDGGRPMVFYFIDEASWTATNWTTVWANVKTHTNLYANPPKFIFENSQTHTQGDGGYAWMANPQTYTSIKQLWWGSSTGTTPDYYSNFYASCLSNPSKVCVGMVKKGFDDGIGFGGGFTGKNRVQSHRAGQTVLDTANLIGSSGFSSSTQIGYIGIPFNDYEESTEMETGIDNQLSLSASIVGTNLSWTITKLDATYSTLSTVSKLQVLCGTTFAVCIDNISPTFSGSVSISGLTGQIYLKALGKPMFFNKFSTLLQIPSPSSPATGLFAQEKSPHF